MDEDLDNLSRYVIAAHEFSEHQRRLLMEAVQCECDNIRGK